MTITIRNLDDVVAIGLSELAKKRGMSREAFARIILTNAVEMQGIKEVEEKYASLVTRIEEVLKQNNEIIKKNTVVIDSISQF